MRSFAPLPCGGSAGAYPPGVNPSSKSEAPLKTRLREASRAAILEATEALLADKGLAGVRMEDVAARARVSVGTIYNHVGDRRALIDALLVAQREELLVRIDAVLARPGKAPFAEVLEAFIRAVLCHFDAHLSLFRLLVEDELAHGRGEGKRSAMRLLGERATRLMDAGAAEGVLDARLAAFHAALLMGMMRGLLWQALFEGPREPGAPLAELAPRTARFFLHGAEGDRR